MDTNYILIDGSYYIFYRYYALMVWWKHSNPTDTIEQPFENELFLEKFNKTFKLKIAEMEKKLNIKNSIKIVGKDCPSKCIWRNKLLPSYKQNRVKDERLIGSNLFKMVYEKKMFINAGVEYILEHDTIEADDCIALATKYIQKHNPSSKIWIITSDMDYLQLSSPNVNIINLKYKKLTDSKQCTKDAECDKFCKIVCGDKSDNIPPIFKRCGIKTAIKLYNNKDEFKKKLDKESAHDKYTLNKTLIDFDMIPTKLVKEFNLKLACII